MNLKRLVSSLMVVSLFLSFSTVHAFSDVGISQSLPDVEISQPEQMKIVVQDLYTTDGETLGKVHKKLTIQIQKFDDGVKAKVTEDNNYDLEPKFASIPAYQRMFSDGIETNTYFIASDNKVYVNGDFLGRFDNFSRLSSPRRMKRDSGGNPRFCNYYDDGKYQNYTFGSYSDIDFSFNDGVFPIGNHISKRIRRGSPFFYDAKSSVDSSQNNLSTLDILFSSFLITLAAEGVSARSCNFLAIILSSAALAIEVLAITNCYNDARNDIRRAYNYINAA